MMAGIAGIAVFLFVILAAVVSVKATDICPFDGTWYYHEATGTCISLQTPKSNYSDAHESCKIFLGGSKRSTPGHLVYIFDEVTDDFVKGLLKESSNGQAFIGLIYTSGYIFTWGDSGQRLGSYKEWADNQPSYQRTKSSVVITTSGWKTFYGQTQTEFVCQVNSAVDSPTISCPPAEVGRQGSITCTIELPNDEVKLSELRIARNDEVKFLCKSQYCWTDTRYENSVGTYSISRLWVLQITKVQRYDEGNYTCSAKFSNNQEITSRPCYLQVYTLPSNVECEASYIKNTVNVTCTSELMYPRADCKWDITIPTYSQKTTHNQNTVNIEVYQNGLTHYKAVCSRTLTWPVAGTYLFNVSVYPVRGSDGTLVSGVTGSLNVLVEPPKQPPVFYDAQDAVLLSELEVKEQQTVSITCRMSRSKPVVYSTVINCYPHGQQESSGSAVSVTMTIRRDFHNQTCLCYGLHLTGPTTTVYMKILVESTPRITYFSIYGRPNQVDFYKNDRISLTCNADGYPQFNLSLMYYQDTIETVSPVIRSYVTKEITATCHSMGNYSCLAQRNAQEKDVKHVQLKVRCAPEYCLGTEQLTKHGAAVGSNKTVHVCVYAYPAPTSFSLIKRRKGRSSIAVDGYRYKASFNYTDETRGRGEISLTIFSVSQQDFGGYQLTTWPDRFTSNLHFELFARGPPDCPKNLTVSSTFSDTITLSWTPGFDGGLQQSFTILRYDSGVTIVAQNVSVVSKPEGNVEAAMSYNVTGLSGSTGYTFGLQAKNEVGVSNCTLEVQASTEASPFSSDDQIVTVVVVPVILGLVLLIIVISVVIVLVRRRRSRGITKSDVAQSLRAQKMISRKNDGQGSSNADAIVGNRPAGQDISKVNNLTKRTPDEIGQDNTYALVVKENNKKTQVEPRDKNIFRRDSDELKQDNTYALVKKPNSKKGKGKSKEGNRPKKDTVEPQQDSTYAQVGKENKKKGKTQKGNQSKEGNEAVVYSNMSNYIEMKPVQDAAADDSVYANVASSSKTGNEQQSPVRDDGRTVTEDGLIYAEVTINVKTTYPEIKGQTRSKVAVLPSKPVEPSVEYVALDFVATARQKL